MALEAFRQGLGREVDPDSWTVRISGLPAWRMEMERNHAGSARNVTAGAEVDGGHGGDLRRADGRGDRQVV